jgi:hypothetical protein
VQCEDATCDCLVSDHKVPSADGEESLQASHEIFSSKSALGIALETSTFQYTRSLVTPRAKKIHRLASSDMGEKVSSVKLTPLVCAHPLTVSRARHAVGLPSSHFRLNTYL